MIGQNFPHGVLWLVRIERYADADIIPEMAPSTKKIRKLILLLFSLSSWFFFLMSFYASKLLIGF